MELSATSLTILNFWKGVIDMTEQEALELGKKLFDNVINGKNNIIEVKDYVEFVGVATESLEKQIPKKPIEIDEKEDDDFYYLSFICGSCLESVFGQSYRPSYCKQCGQKLDWGDKDAVD